MTDNPVYIVYRENGESRKTKTLHRNLSLLVNDLPVEAPAMTPASMGPERKKKSERHTKSNNVDNEDSDMADSDEESSVKGYWLRTPVSWSTTGNNQLLGRMPVGEETRSIQERENSRHREEQRTEESTSNEHPYTYLDTACPEVPDDGDKANSNSQPVNVERVEGLGVEEETSMRRSARERMTRQMYTYDTFGQPTIHPYTTLNSITAYPIPHMPFWSLHNYTTPITYPYLYLPSVHTPYGVTTAVY